MDKSTAVKKLQKTFCNLSGDLTEEQLEPLSMAIDALSTGDLLVDRVYQGLVALCTTEKANYIRNICNIDDADKNIEAYRRHYVKVLKKLLMFRTISNLEYARGLELLRQAPASVLD